MSLDSFLPNYFTREIHYFAVKTSPSETFRAVCDFDMARTPWIQGLFRLRTLLDRRGEQFVHLTLRDTYKNGGFTLLEEVPEEELVVGAIGKIWHPVLAFEKVESQDFYHFHQKGFGKVAWSLRCEPRLSGNGTLGSFEVRVGATDALSTAQMRAYYSMIRPFSRAIRRSTFKRLTLQLGDAFSEESERFLPGDEIIPNPFGSATHSIMIEAPPEAIWPWLSQMGCSRAGWYSYDWLDNGGIPSASRIVSKWQNLRIGDILPATPNDDAGWIVLESQPPNVIVLGGCWDLDSQESLYPNVALLPANYWRSTWSFVLEPQSRTVTRLIVRARGDFRAESKHDLRLRTMFLPHIHDLMQRRQLSNVKRRAEKTAPHSGPKIPG